MKKSVLSIAIVCLLCVLPAKAQTTNAPQQFLTSVTEWLTVQNTNNAWTTNDHASLFLGVDTQNSLGVSASAGLSARVYKQVILEGVVRNASIAGTVVSLQGGGGLQFDVIDVRLSATLGAGYSFDKSDSYAYIAATAMKKLSTRTGLFVRIENDLFLSNRKSNVPVLSIGTVITF